MGPMSQPVAGLFSDGAVCPECHYSLQGLTAATCPECGKSLELVLRGDPLIPWERRSTLGGHRAYWASVWGVLFDRRFPAAVQTPLDYSSAHGFQWITTLHTCVHLAATFGLIYLTFPAVAQDWVANTAAWFVAVCCGFIVVWLHVIGCLPAMAANLVGSTEQVRTRGATLTRYGCAVIHLWPCILAFLWLAWAIGYYFVNGQSFARMQKYFKEITGAALLTAPFVLALLQLLMTRRLLVHAVGPARSQFLIWLVGAGLAVGATLLIVIGLPLLLYFGALCFYSIR